MNTMSREHELLPFHAWRQRYRYRHGKSNWYIQDDVDMYQRYCEEYRLEEYQKSRGPEIDKAVKDNTPVPYDELVKVYEIKQDESIKFKQHQECKLFRCLKCWLLIHPDDNIVPFKEGYMHRVCDNRRLSIDNAV